MTGNPASSAPFIVLVEPQLGENIGMCARAMLNCGLDRLRLVRPRDGWPNPAATATAADADEVLAGAEVFDSLDAALSDCHRVFAATARRRSLALPILDAPEVAARAVGAVASGERVAVLFGAEASGLENESVARAEAVLHFGTNPDFPSLNLAQSVLLFGWEWLKAGDVAAPAPSSDPPASRDELAAFFDRLEGALEQRGFFLTPELRPTVSNTLRSLFSRSAPTGREVAMLHGALTALLRPPAE